MELTERLIDSHLLPNGGIYSITPGVAAAILKDRAVRCRDLRPRWVAELARAIKRGEFVHNGETIVFSCLGTLLDGRHRLAAVVSAQMPITSAVAFGISPSAAVTIDQ